MSITIASFRRFINELSSLMIKGRRNLELGLKFSIPFLFSFGRAHSSGLVRLKKDVRDQCRACNLAHVNVNRQCIIEKVLSLDLNSILCDSLNSIREALPFDLVGLIKNVMQASQAQGYASPQSQPSWTSINDGITHRQ